MSRITPEIAEKIEAMITKAEECGHRAAMIEFGLRDLTSVSCFLSIMRSLGVEVYTSGRMMSPKDRKDFIEFLRAKKAAAPQ